MFCILSNQFKTQNAIIFFAPYFWFVTIEENNSLMFFKPSILLVTFGREQQLDVLFNLINIINIKIVGANIFHCTNRSTNICRHVYAIYNILFLDICCKDNGRNLSLKSWRTNDNVLKTNGNINDFVKSKKSSSSKLNYRSL